MKFLKENKKLFLTITFLSIPFFGYTLSNQIIPSQGFSFTSLFRGIVGILFLIFISYILSSNKKSINWRTATFGLILQIILAIGILKVTYIKVIFESAGKVFIKILDFTQEGTKFLFAELGSNPPLMDSAYTNFIVVILPTVIFFSALTSVLFYLGIIQKIVKFLAMMLSKILGISGPESLSVAGNIFLGQTESPLMIKAYLEKMSKSEILLVMIGGMATVAGGVLAAYIGFLGGDNAEMKIYYAKHLLAASVMAAPGAIVISKILFPETEKIDKNVKISKEKIGTNLLDSISIGTSEGLKLAVNIAAMLLVFIAFIAMFNFILSSIGSIFNINDWIDKNTVYNELSLELILGYIFAPIMWLIGVAKEDITLMGQLLGIKLAASEFIGYIQLANLKDAANIMHLSYQKSIIIATYMLCGFANFASIGIQIGGIGALEPKQRKNLSKFGFKALIGGTIASLLSATIAGMIIG
jgi:CNT family concentrative nucleoside transporter